MLVINANNQQDTTNYMLADPWYPDTDSILMWGWPDVVRFRSINWGASITGDWINDSPVIDTIGTEPINYYCPKFYKSWLRQWQIIKTTYTFTNPAEILPSFWCFVISSGNPYALTISGDTWYRIAVKWLKAGQIVWEKIFAPLLFYTSIPSYALDWTVSITFWLLHSDWTKTQICSSQCSYAWWTAPFSSWKLISAIQSWLWWYYVTSLWTLTYNWTWQTAQDNDILYADVIINWMSTRYWNNNSWWVGVAWILYWQTNNNNLWDLNWFRPFQVSIRDA